jgi:hypothetical protein
MKPSSILPIIIVMLAALSAGCRSTAVPDADQDHSVQGEETEEFAERAPDVCEIWDQGREPVLFVRDNALEEPTHSILLEDGTLCSISSEVDPGFRFDEWIFRIEEGQLYGKKHADAQWTAYLGDSSDLAPASDINVDPAGARVMVLDQAWETPETGVMAEPSERVRLVVVDLQTYEHETIYAGLASDLACPAGSCLSRKLNLEIFGWSSNGDSVIVGFYHWIPFAAGILRDVWEIPLDGAAPKLIMDAEEEFESRPFDDLPQLSPDRRELAFLQPGERHTIEILNLETASRRIFQLSDEVGFGTPGTLEWAPDGGRLKLETIDLWDEGKSSGVVLLDLASGNEFSLTNNQAEMLDWCSDHSILIDDDGQIRVVDTASRQVQTFNPGELEVLGCWVNE